MHEHAATRRPSEDDRPHGPPPGGSRDAAARLLELQRGAGNSAVRGLVQREIGWGKGTGKNAGPGRDTKDTSVKRIPIRGVPEGLKPGRAIVAVPHGKTPKTVDVLFHLHGWHLYGAGAGYGEHGNELDDESLYRVEAQLDELEQGGRELIAVLPQGPLGKDLGKGEKENVSIFGSEGKPTSKKGQPAAVDVDAYITSAVSLAEPDWPYKPLPTVGRVILSGHSGAGEPLSQMFQSSLGHEQQPDKEKSLLPDRPKLEGFVSFDTINTQGQYDSHRAFIQRQLELDREGIDAVKAVAKKTPEAEIAKRQVEWLGQRGFRFDAFFTPGGYASWYDDPKSDGSDHGIVQFLDGWFKTNTGDLPDSVRDAFRANYVVKGAGVEIWNKKNKVTDKGHMEMIGGRKGKSGWEHENLREAIGNMPK